mgnify:FL=1|jgi:hypothetical protein
MATKLFINRTDMIRNSVMDANINSDKFIQFLKIAQEITIQSYLGTDLYDKITSLLPTAIDDAANSDYKTLLNDYIQPALIHWAQVEYYPYAAIEVRAGGVFRHVAENAETASRLDVDYLVEKERTHAEWYTRRMLDYLSQNNSKYPEYSTNSGSDVFPQYDSLFNGWVL